MHPFPRMFKSIPPGCGGTLPHTAINSSGQPFLQLLYFGTHNCKTGVGVYFEVDEYRAFVAHIDAAVAISNDTFVTTCTEHEGAIIKDRIFHELSQQALNDRWSLDPIRTRGSLHIICPQTEIGAHERWKISDAAGIEHKTGWYVLQAIKEFLGVPLTMPDDLCHSGFIVDKVMRRTRLLPYREEDGVEVRPEDMGFFPFVEPAYDGWRFAVPAIK